MRVITKYMKRLTVVFFAVSMSVSLSAQTMPSLMLNQDPAAIARGMSGVASEAGGYALQNNVAAMSLSENKLASRIGIALWQPSYAGIKAVEAGAMYRFGDKLGFGVDLKMLKMPTYGGVTDTGSDIRESAFSPSEMNLAFGASYAILDFLSAGVTLRYAGSSLAPEAKATVFGADLGLYYKKDAIRAGLSLNNLGTKVKYSEAAYSQPSLVKAGVAYALSFGTSVLDFSAEADVIFSGGIMAGAGCEYSFKDMVFARAGYHYGDSVNAIPSYASAGLGLKLFGVGLDFAYIFASEVMGNSMCLSLGYSF